MIHEYYKYLFLICKNDCFDVIAIYISMIRDQMITINKEFSNENIHSQNLIIML